MPTMKLLNCYIAKLFKNNSTISERKRVITIKQSHSGFTLIELLIVISIIGILATLTLASYNGAQAKSRDGVRKNDLAQIKRALELAKADCTNGAWYPYKADYTALITFLGQGSAANAYMNPVPKDPQDPTSTYAYYSVSNATAGTCAPDVPGASCTGTCFGTANYTLRAILERVSDTDGLRSWQRCAGKPYNGSPATIPADGSGYPGTGVYVVCNN